MKSTFATRSVLVLGVLLLLRGAYTEAKTWISFVNDSDFTGYYTAACLVHNHGNQFLYEEAASHTDPTEMGADPGTVFARTARARGITNVGLYDYPPTLADLLIPFTSVNIFLALCLWLGVNVVALAVAGLMLLKMAEIPPGTYFAWIVASLFLFRPVLECFYYGQIAVVLLLLLVAAVSLYLSGHKQGAALLMAVAGAIKLTPLIMVVPLFAWRDWKALRAFALWLVAILMAMMAINGTGTLNTYFVQELPSMASKIVDVTNHSLGTALQIFWLGTEKGTPSPVVAWVGRLLSLLVLCIAGWLSRAEKGKHPTRAEIVEIVAMFLLLSCCISPISWVHAYVLSIPALIILGKKLWRGRLGIPQTVLLGLFVAEVSTNRLISLARGSQLPAIYALAVLAPLLGIVLALTTLYRLRLDRRNGILLTEL